jgi:hypothetical protein
VPQQSKFVSPIEFVPLGHQFFAVTQLGLPFLPPASAQAARHDQADEFDQPERQFCETVSHRFNYLKCVQIEAEYNRPLEMKPVKKSGNAPWVRIASSVQAWQDAH